MLHIVEGPRHIERCHVDGVVHAVLTLDDSANKIDVITAAVDSIPEDSLLLIQLDQSVDPLH